METPGEPGAGPLGAPSPSNFAPEHLEREKLVKLEGQPAREGRDCRAACILEQRRGKGLGKGPSPWVPAQAGACPQASPGPAIRCARRQRWAGRWAPAARTHCEPAGTLAAHEACVAAAAGQRRGCTAHAEDRAPWGESCPYPLNWPSEGGRERGRPEPLTLTLSIRRHSWYGDLTLASAKLCACGCLRPAAPPSSPATISRKALGVRGTGLEGRGWKQSGQGTAGFLENDFTSHLSGVSLEGSELVFPDLVQLICSYCHTR